MGRDRSGGGLPGLGTDTKRRFGDLRGRSASVGRSPWIPEEDFREREDNMHTTHVKIEDVQRGSLIQVAGGFVVADTASTTPGSRDGRVLPMLFWWDTDGGRHFANPTDGTLVLALPGFRTNAFGETRNGGRHVLLNQVPRESARGLCPASRNSDLHVWGSGIALSSVNCFPCRRMASLVGKIK